MKSGWRGYRPRRELQLVREHAQGGGLAQAVRVGGARRRRRRHPGGLEGEALCCSAALLRRSTALKQWT
eukprot:COSAG03_NODE_7470_length_913_cov_4.567568_1_plen_69_part_00